MKANVFPSHCNLEDIMQVFYGTVQIWDWDSKNLLEDFAGYHTGKVKSLAVTPDGKTVVSGSADKTVKIWDFDF